MSSPSNFINLDFGSVINKFIDETDEFPNNAIKFISEFAKNKLELIDFNFSNSSLPKIEIDEINTPLNDNFKDETHKIFSLRLGEYIADDNKIIIYKKNIESLDLNTTKMMEIVLAHELFHAYHFHKLKAFIGAKGVLTHELCMDFWYHKNITNNQEMYPFVKESLATGFEINYTYYRYKENNNDEEYYKIYVDSINSLDMDKYLSKKDSSPYNGGLLFVTDDVIDKIKEKYVEKEAVSNKFRQILHLSLFNFSYAFYLSIKVKNAITLAKLETKNITKTKETKDINLVSLEEYPMLRMDEYNESIQNYPNKVAVNIKYIKGINYTFVVPLCLIIDDFVSVTNDNLIGIDFNNFNTMNNFDFILIHGRKLTNFCDIFDKFNLPQGNNPKSLNSAYLFIDCPNIFDVVSKCNDRRGKIYYLTYRYFHNSDLANLVEDGRIKEALKKLYYEAPNGSINNVPNTTSLCNSYWYNRWISSYT